MTQEDWKLLLPFVQAGAEGKRIEVNYGDKMYWQKLQGDSLLSVYPSLIRIGALRIAPEPTFVPWTDDEVPLDAWYRCNSNPYWYAKITERNIQFGPEPLDKKLVVTIGCFQLSLDELCNNYTHSTDGCKTWKRCGKEVAQ